MSEVLVFYSRVLKLVEEKTRRDQINGWYMQLEGSWESLYAGMEKPDFAVGERVKVKIEKMP